MGELAEGLLSLSGWAALAFLFTLPALEAPAFLGLVLPGEVALLLGGVLYSVGAVIYAIGRPNPFPRIFGFHEIFHLFVIAGSVIHFSLVAVYVL